MSASPEADPAPAHAGLLYAYEVPTEIVERIARTLSSATLVRLRLASRECRRVADELLFSTANLLLADTAENRFKRMSGQTLSALKKLAIEIWISEDQDTRWILALVGAARSLREISVAAVVDSMLDPVRLRAVVYNTDLFAGLARLADLAPIATFELSYYASATIPSFPLLQLLTSFPLERIKLLTLGEAVLANPLYDPVSTQVIAIVERLPALQLQVVAIGDTHVPRLRGIPDLRLGIAELGSPLHPASQISVQDADLTTALLPAHHSDLRSLALWTFPDALPNGSSRFLHLTALEIGHFGHQGPEADPFEIEDNDAVEFLSMADLPALTTLRLELWYTHSKRLRRVLENNFFPELSVVELKVHAASVPDGTATTNDRLLSALRELRTIGQMFDLRGIDPRIALDDAWVPARSLGPDIFPIVGLRRIALRVATREIPRVLANRHALMDVEKLEIGMEHDPSANSGCAETFLFSHFLASLHMPRLEYLELTNASPAMVPNLVTLIQNAILSAHHLSINTRPRTVSATLNGTATAVWRELVDTCRNADVELTIDGRTRTCHFLDGDRRRRDHV